MCFSYSNVEPKLGFSGKSCDPRMTIVTVACGNRIEEAITLFQSVLLLSRCDMTFIVYVETKDLSVMQTTLTALAAAKHFRHPHVDLIVKEAVYPNETTSDGKLWKNIYGPCSTIRLFFPVNSITLKTRLIVLLSDVILTERHHVIILCVCFFSKHNTGLSD